MFVREQLEEGVNENGILVPQRAVGHNQRGEATVTTVDSDNKANVQIIKTDRAVGDQWLVSEGVKPGDKVIMLGIQGVQPGATVHPHEVTPQELAPPPATPPAPQKQ
jgi:membrane fusion protein, multidrug efflux system